MLAFPQTSVARTGGSPYFAPTRSRIMLGSAGSSAIVPRSHRGGQPVPRQACSAATRPGRSSRTCPPSPAKSPNTAVGEVRNAASTSASSGGSSRNDTRTWPKRCIAARVVRWRCNKVKRPGARAEPWPANTSDKELGSTPHARSARPSISLARPACAPTGGQTCNNCPSRSLCPRSAAGTATRVKYPASIKQGTTWMTGAHSEANASPMPGAPRSNPTATSAKWPPVRSASACL